MEFNIDVLDESEKIIFALRTLYRSQGYRRYRMSKFEEYDLYSRNKDFLVSDSVITFMDLNGKLMALKPDVTLSLIKNNKDKPEEIQKLYYNENVYRVQKGSDSFKEIMQAGLECFGAVDPACISEVLMLAAKSLDLISPDFMLEISDLEILSFFLDRIPVSGDVRRELLKCVSEKNRHEILHLLRSHEVQEQYGQDLIRVLELYGGPDHVMEGLRDLCAEKGLEEEVERLTRVISVFRESAYKDRILIDFSAVSDLNYYNGIIFRGFISGVPEEVLSGGQYDRLMKKMGRKSRACGFAVYLNKLQGIMR
ncbi:MAG: ATP phosphoribosyltransferase regulatory subunit [Parasporobacterium sp.]|nr:ATP phosphoribosyltransferase regulatory subunit [Parasporobacterium sp.]MBQ9033033.1 ATP phosphoribosyltransferase regulatory subunit [Parasporobacterium sp.]